MGTIPAVSGRGCPTSAGLLLPFRSDSGPTPQHHPDDVQQQRVATVVADMSMSLDGFIADTDDGVDRVFAWYTKPQPPRHTADDGDRDSSGLGVIVYGRRTFEVANGWGGNHPLGVPVIVLTHSIPDGWPRPDSSVLFNTEGIQSAIAQAKTLADGKDVALGSRRSPSNASTSN